MRNPQATAAANAAGQASGGYGATASGIGSTLVPFATRQLTNPQGMSQRDIGAQVTAGLAGTGGATAGLTGAAGRMGTESRNPMGFSGALDAAAQSRDKGGAMVGEKIAASNADVKLKQQDEAGGLLSGLYGMSSKAQTGEAEAQQKDLETANQLSPAMQMWLQMSKNAASAASGGADA